MKRGFVERALLALLIMMPPAAVLANAAPVQSYFQQLKGLRAEFIQTVYSASGRLLETSSGEMLMQKPGRFRWDYRKPYAQTIVADGERLWHYDSELEQVTVKRLDQALSSTPLALLSGSAPLEQSFDIRDGGSRDGLHWYELTPKPRKSDEPTEFQVLRLAFAAGEQLKVIEVVDAFNQRTRLELDKLERNPSLDAGLFRFTPPKGADVIGDVP
ncbi:MAG TPA: outer membrane lipoprotein chaperone LolA [Candidatus Competibacteraceae bacterium]|nr:outer membrane lipoprotein chaperone LolA [Candidatus Competibacteraceae bacterium]